MSRNLALPTASGKFGREITADYNEVNLLETDDAKRAKLEMWIAKNVGASLVKTYPNREWGVRVDLNGGMVIISCDSLCSERGYHISMEGRSLKDLQVKAKQAGGEILERFGISRERAFNPDELETLERHPVSHSVLSDSEDTKPDAI